MEAIAYFSEINQFHISGSKVMINNLAEGIPGLRFLLDQQTASMATASGVPAVGFKSNNLPLQDLPVLFKLISECLSNPTEHQLFNESFQWPVPKDMAIKAFVLVDIQQKGSFELLQVNVCPTETKDAHPVAFRFVRQNCVLYRADFSICLMLGHPRPYPNDSIYTLCFTEFLNSLKILAEGACLEENDGYKLLQKFQQGLQKAKRVTDNQAVENSFGHAVSYKETVEDYRERILSVLGGGSNCHIDLSRKRLIKLYLSFPVGYHEVLLIDEEIYPDESDMDNDSKNIFSILEYVISANNVARPQARPVTDASVNKNIYLGAINASAENVAEVFLHSFYTNAFTKHADCIMTANKAVQLLLTYYKQDGDMQESRDYRQSEQELPEARSSPFTVFRRNISQVAEELTQLGLIGTLWNYLINLVSGMLSCEDYVFLTFLLVELLRGLTVNAGSHWYLFVLIGCLYRQNCIVWVETVAYATRRYLMERAPGSTSRLGSVIRKLKIPCCVLIGWYLNEETAPASLYSATFCLWYSYLFPRLLSQKCTSIEEAIAVDIRSKGKCDVRIISTYFKSLAAEDVDIVLKLTFLFIHHLWGFQTPQVLVCFALLYWPIHNLTREPTLLVRGFRPDNSYRLHGLAVSFLRGVIVTVVVFCARNTISMLYAPSTGRLLLFLSVHILSVASFGRILSGSSLHLEICRYLNFTSPYEPYMKTASKLHTPAVMVFILFASMAYANWLSTWFAVLAALLCDLVWIAFFLLRLMHVVPFLFRKKE